MKPLVFDQVTRPPVRWHGGKWKMGRKIVPFFPKHACYTEVYGGGASVLLQKPRCRAELYNDLDTTIVELFRVLRDPVMASRLLDLLRLTPFARDEFNAAYERVDDPVENARRTIVRSFMGYGSDGTAGAYKTGFRANVTSTLKLPASEWSSYPDALQAVCQRIRPTDGSPRGVVIENTEALPLLRRMDASHTLHYVDPPYLPSTRSQGNRRRGQGYHVYQHELSEDDHVELLDTLKQLDGMVVLSGYPSDLYDSQLVGWRSVSFDAYADGGRPRTEMIWLNPATQLALEHGPLFAEREC